MSVTIISGNAWLNQTVSRRSNTELLSNETLVTNNLNQNEMIFDHANAFENVVSRMIAILSQSQCVKRNFGEIWMHVMTNVHYPQRELTSCEMFEWDPVYSHFTEISIRRQWQYRIAEWLIHEWHCWYIKVCTLLSMQLWRLSLAATNNRNTTSAGICLQLQCYKNTMITSSNGNIFRVTGHLCGEFTGDRWIPRTTASDAEFWCFHWSAPE